MRKYRQFESLSNGSKWKKSTYATIEKVSARAVQFSSQLNLSTRLEKRALKQTSVKFMDWNFYNSDRDDRERYICKVHNQKLSG